MTQAWTIRVKRSAAALSLALALAAPCAVSAQVTQLGDKQEGTPNVKPTVLNGVGLQQKIGSQLPLDAPFVDDTGKAVKLGDYFGQKPVLFGLVYYQCPLLCSEEMDGLTSSLEMVRYKPGKDFNIVVISIDPSETPAMAAAKKATYVKRFGPHEVGDGWHFLTGPQSSIDRVATAVGYRYVRVPGPDGQLSQYAHTSAIEVMTPQGKVAQYFYGVEYSPKDVLFALMQASGGKVGSPVEELVLYCYHYSPTTGHYSLIIARVVQLACLATVLCFGSFLFVMFRQDAVRDAAVRNA